VARAGHGDWVVVADHGLPIPRGPQRIELGVRDGLPTVLEVVRALLEELVTESAILASESRTNSKAWHEDALRSFNGLEVEYLDHERLKQGLKDSLIVVRTGERTPYANVVLVGGVDF
jgi:D-ribose pyranase